jgi:hypothetical protein
MKCQRTRRARSKSISIDRIIELERFFYRRGAAGRRVESSLFFTRESTRVRMLRDTPSGERRGCFEAVINLALFVIVEMS